MSESTQKSIREKYVESISNILQKLSILQVRVDELHSTEKDMLARLTILEINRAHSFIDRKEIRKIIKDHEKRIDEFYEDISDDIAAQSAQIKEQERDLGHLDERISGLEEMGIEPRILRLESSNITQGLDPKVWAFVNERLDSLEIKTNKMFYNIELLLNHQKQVEKPNVCPVCMGKGSSSLKELTNGTPFIIMPCPSCEGKGIVWG